MIENLYGSVDTVDKIQNKTPAKKKAKHGANMFVGVFVPTASNVSFLFIFLFRVCLTQN
jgi:hypothetical protein